MTPFTVQALTLLAEAEPQPNFLTGLLPILPSVLVMFLLWMFIVQRPQRKEQALRRDMLSNLKKNDHVLLHSGIYGVVANVRPDADEVTVKIDESANVKIRVTRASIARVITDQPETSTESAST